MSLFDTLRAALPFTGQKKTQPYDPNDDDLLQQVQRATETINRKAEVMREDRIVSALRSSRRPHEHER